MGKTKNLDISASANAYSIVGNRAHRKLLSGQNRKIREGGSGKTKVGGVRVVSVKGDER